MSRSILLIIKNSLRKSSKNIIFYFLFFLLFPLFKNVYALENNLYNIEKQEKILNVSIASLNLNDIKQIERYGRGFKTVLEKSEVLIPFKYHIAVENLSF